MQRLEMEVLEQVYFEPSTLADISQRLAAPKGPVSHAIKALVQKSLATIDPRHRIVRATPAGKTWVESGNTRNHSV